MSGQNHHCLWYEAQRLNKLLIGLPIPHVRTELPLFMVRGSGSETEQITDWSPHSTCQDRTTIVCGMRLGDWTNYWLVSPFHMSGQNYHCFWYEAQRLNKLLIGLPIPLVRTEPPLFVVWGWRGLANQNGGTSHCSFREERDKHCKRAGATAPLGRILIVPVYFIKYSLFWQ
jgi:hypothetical protein